MWICSAVLSFKSIPSNVTFEIDDAEADWTYTQPFDFIYVRMMLGAFKNWPRFFEQAFAYVLFLLVIR